VSVDPFAGEARREQAPASSVMSARVAAETRPCPRSSGQEIVVHQDDLAVGGEHAVDLGGGAAVLAGGGKRGERVLRRSDRMAAMAADWT
jgi:hypothetical protein